MAFELGIIIAFFLTVQSITKTKIACPAAIATCFFRVRRAAPLWQARRMCPARTRRRTRSSRQALPLVKRCGAASLHPRRRAGRMTRPLWPGARILFESSLRLQRSLQQSHHISDPDARPAGDGHLTVLHRDRRVEPAPVFLRPQLVLLIAPDVRHARSEMEHVDETEPG